MAHLDQKEMQKSYDNDIRDWGFTESHCFHCGKSNSEIDGLLMQCGRCRKVNYCSNDCFNNGLEEHKKIASPLRCLDDSR